MESRRFCFVASVVMLAAWSLPASAAKWLYVGTFGTDSATCGPSTTCRTLQQAATNASPGDYILLESADSGPATITKSLAAQDLVAHVHYYEKYPGERARYSPDR